VKSRELTVQFLSSKDEIADIFTKPLVVARFTLLLLYEQTLLGIHLCQMKKLLFENLEMTAWLIKLFDIISKV
jgi:hypothetical protein